MSHLNLGKESMGDDQSARPSDAPLEGVGAKLKQAPKGRSSAAVAGKDNVTTSSQRDDVSEHITCKVYKRNLSKTSVKSFNGEVIQESFGLSSRGNPHRGGTNRHEYQGIGLQIVLRLVPPKVNGLKASQCC
jgi:hypothetical protein